MQGADQGRPNTCLAKSCDCIELRLDQRNAPQRFRLKIVKGVELEIDLATVFQFRQQVDQLVVSRDSYPIGIDHHDIDGLIASISENLLKLRMDGGLAAG